MSAMTTRGVLITRTPLGKGLRGKAARQRKRDLDGRGIRRNGKPR